MAHIIWTPWRSHDELLTVTSQLYFSKKGEQPDERVKACSLISAWRLRRKLPHAVESTWWLTEAVLADEKMASGKMNAVTVRASYNTAFCRFVTGLVDTEQDGAFKSSMYETAKQIGLPASFIDIRHDAIHGDLPSLVILREATRDALEWLWNDYWKRLVAEMDRRPLRNDRRKTSKEQLRTILLSHRSIAPTTKSTNQPQHLGFASETNPVCLRLVKACQSEKLALMELVDVLVEQDNLIPRARVLGDTMDGAISVWGSLLRQLTFHQRSFLNILSQKLITQITSPSLIEPEVDTHREAVHFWLLEIYLSRDWSSARKRGKINAEDLLLSCLQNPNLWTGKITFAIINQPSSRRLNTIYEDRIAAPLRMTARATSQSPQPSKISDKDLADLLAYQQVWLEEAEKPGQQEGGSGSPKLAAGGWRKCTGEWTAKPFGTV